MRSDIVSLELFVRPSDSILKASRTIAALKVLILLYQIILPKLFNIGAWIEKVG